MIYADRVDAGQVLAHKLKLLKLKGEIVAAIPRGGVVVGVEIARVLHLRIFPLVIKKLGAPANPELAIGATASFGKPVLDRWLIADLDVGYDYIKKETIKKRKEAKAREKFLGFAISKINLNGKTVIVVDDGLATGQTVRLAGKILKQIGAAKLILAVPCAPPSAIGLVKGEYNEVICPEVSDNFTAVGQFYHDFRPAEEAEVKKLLQGVDS